MTCEPMHSAQAQSVGVTEKYFLFVGHHCRDVTRSDDVYFILISKSSPCILSYRSMYS